MPIYEYRCNACGQQSQLFFRSFSSAGEVRCPHCESTDLGRVPSRVAYVRSESSYQDFLTDPSNFEGVDYNDPRAVASWAQRIGQAAGMDLGSDYQDLVEGVSEGGSGGDLSDPDLDLP
ncbi:MAG: zinc ribbon domain-containing protein [Chloroflexi bacterium]|nr:zinc ribbon domain-containing protein [Chloroflexota bacterium]